MYVRACVSSLSPLYLSTINYFSALHRFTEGVNFIIIIIIILGLTKAGAGASQNVVTQFFFFSVIFQLFLLSCIPFVLFLLFTFNIISLHKSWIVEKRTNLNKTHSALSVRCLVLINSLSQKKKSAFSFPAQSNLEISQISNFKSFLSYQRLGTLAFPLFPILFFSWFL